MFITESSNVPSLVSGFQNDKRLVLSDVVINVDSNGSIEYESVTASHYCIKLCISYSHSQALSVITLCS